MIVPYRTLAPSQSCEVWVHDMASGTNKRLFTTTDLLLEAPNWTLQDDALILNGNGTLWRLPLAAPALRPISITGVPPLNNDHVPDPDGRHIFLSAYEDWQLYRAAIEGGPATRLTGQHAPPGLMHFLHGVSPDGKMLAFTGLRRDETTQPPTLLSAEIFTLDATGQNYRQLTHAGAPADGPEFSPDGNWIHFNTEAFSGHAQIARMRSDGTDQSRLIVSDTVDWFPHLSPDGRNCVYLAFPPGTRGHPADLPVTLMLVQNDDWANARAVARLFGGQGTINVNSWSPDSSRFAYVAYPMPSPT